MWGAMADERVASDAGEERCDDGKQGGSSDGRAGPLEHSRLRVVTSRNGLSTLKAAPHQVAGHLFERGKAGSFIDDVGHFYKPLQPGPRGEREESFYTYLTSKKRADQLEIQLNKSESHGYSWVLQLQRLLGDETSFSEAVRESLLALGCDLSGMRDLVGGSNSSSYLSRDETGMSHVQGHSFGDLNAPITSFSIQRFPTFSRAASDLYEAKLAAASPMNVLQNDEFGLMKESERWLSGDEIVWSDDEVDVAVPSASVRVDLMALPFTLRNAPLLKVVPKFYGVITCPDGSMLMEMEDVARMYDRPAVMDVKIGIRTWYEDAAPDYIAKCMDKDACTTQSTLGFKICGMQVYRNSLQGFWRASKQWCKTLTEASVDNALQSFVHNESGLRPIDVYGGPDGVIRQLEQIEEWVKLQNEFSFFSSSILVMYEGLAGKSSDMQHAPNVSVRLVDFAHTFVHGYRERDDRPVDAPRQRDENFLKGLRGFRRRLLSICNR